MGDTLTSCGPRRSYGQARRLLSASVRRGGSARVPRSTSPEHGNWWVNYEYRVDDAQQPMGRPAPLAQWRLHRERENAQLLPIDTDVRNARKSLNAVAATLGRAQRPAEWPLRKELMV